MILYEESDALKHIEECVNFIKRYSEEKKLTSISKEMKNDDEHLRMISELKKKTIRIKK